MASPPRHTCQAGFTLVEVMMAMLVLLVGVLGVVTMVDGANAVTSRTKAREGGTALARSVIEVSRSIRYRDLTTATLEDALNTRPGLADSRPATPGYTFESRAVEYRMTLTVCSLDDAKDGLGVQPPGVAFCPDSDKLPAGGVAQDRNPDDYKRVRVKLIWKTRGAEYSVTQTSSIINPVGGLGPSVTGLAMTSPASSSATEVRIDSPVNSADFTAVTSTFAAELSWSVNGDSQGKANGGPTNWTFRWNFVDGSDILYYDCNYFIQADAVDNEGRAGAPRVLSVIVNRIAPVSPTNFVGGRNGSGDRVDLRWNPNPECDVIGYRVFRSTDPASVGTAIDCDLGAPDPTLTTKVSCVDEAAPATGPLYYRVLGVDSDAAGNPRNGTVSAQLTVPASGGNSLPTPPAGLTSCVGGQPACNGPDGEPAPSGQIVIRWLPSLDVDGTVASYRIYRNGTTYADRWDEFFPAAGGQLAWLEYDDEGAPHTYRVTAVDDLFGESGLSAPITAP